MHNMYTISYVIRLLINGLLYTGSVCEMEGEKIYNTCTVFGPSGNLLGKYRKVSIVYQLLHITFLIWYKWH